MQASKTIRPRSIHGGADVPHFKNTAEAATVEITAPEKVLIPMSQHIGAPCAPTVKVGDLVRVGQLIGASESFVSAPIHASISGKVTAIPDLLMPGGATVKAVQITSDGKMELDDTLCAPSVASKDDFIMALKYSGLVGLGGAGFPAYVKLNPKNLNEVNTLIINAAECEPYITSDYRECMEGADDVIEGILLVKKWLQMKEVYIGIEDNKPRAIRLLADKLRSHPDINVVKLKSRYPKGAEKVLIYEVTGKKVPEGGLPADIGVMVQNVASIAFINRYFKTGVPLTTKRITLDGSAIAKPMNVRVPIGTLISDVAAFAGGYREPPVKILMGGPMMGTALRSDDFPIIKQNNAILFLTQRDLPKNTEPTACIRCGRCVSGCPMNLMPVSLESAYHAGDLDELSALKVMACMECGTCEFSCPAKRPLVSVIRLAKQAVRARKN